MKRPALLNQVGRVAAESAWVRADLIARGFIAPSSTKRPEKAKSPRIATAGPSVHNPIAGGSNHGISKV